MTPVSNRGIKPESHTCFGCQKQIADYEEHIHVGLDEFSAKMGVGGEPFGLDDILTFAFCSECIEQGGPFLSEAHEVSAQ